MIDTDKYEGHTIDSMTASQASKTHWFLEHPSSPVHSQDILVNKATVDLIQEAPLLLAEIIRLREEVSLLKNSYIALTGRGEYND